MTPLALPDETATLRLGAALAAGTVPGRVLFLRGELGTGKTTLVRGLLRALGHAGRVPSPSYSLLELYSVSSLNLYHFDFYRLRDRSEWVNSGFRDYFGAEAVCIVEWPQRVGDALPLPDLEIRLELAGAGRRAQLRARTPSGQSWLDDTCKRWSQP